MPTYEYECEKGHRFEVFQSMKDAALSACTECGAPARRIIGPGAGFLFKGSGFYTTEYRSKEYKKQAKAEAAGGSGGGTSGGAGTAPSGGSGSSSSTGASGGDKPAGGDKSAGGAKPSGGDQGSA